MSMIDGDEAYIQPPPVPPFGYWLKHMATVPKGYLRYQVLELLKEKPMSGSEIMNEIEKRTNGCWKPSPGSVYPLLAWLQDRGYIREVPSEESGMRRYNLTDKGKQLLEEQQKMRAHYVDRMFFVSPVMGTFWMRIPPERASEIRVSFRRLFKALIGLGLALEEQFDEQAVKEALAVLNDASKRLEEIGEKLKGEKA
ncbi:MAG: PadR family transcriptional regulator [Nitrososphaeria archaeon]